MYQIGLTHSFARRLGTAALCFAALYAAGRSARAEASLAKRVIETYARNAYAEYSRSKAAAVELEASVKAFLAAPGEATQNAAKDAWKRAHAIYVRTEVYRFYDGPIDRAPDGPEALINGWPLDEVYIDYVEGAPDGGIINSPGQFPIINDIVLADLNERNGEENIATGFHAAEFLLWGQDLSRDGAGARSWKDYITGGSAKNAERRSQYLRTVAEMLVMHLDHLCHAWDPDSPTSFASELKRTDEPAALQKIFTGIAMLTADELAAERTAVAYETRDQEDEQSCFSDTTLANHAANAEAIQNVYLGRSGGEDGPGLDELVRAKDAELDAALRERIEASIAAIRAIPPPFDNAVRAPDGSPERKALLAAIESLETQGELLASAAARLGISLNLAEAQAKLVGVSGNAAP